VTKRRFKPIPSFAGGVNISDSVLIVEGALPNWRDFDEEAERAAYFAEKALYGEKAMASAMPCTPETQAHVPMADAFTKPLTPPPAPRTVRRFTARPRPTDADADGFRITEVRGGLPDWLHQNENRALARAEYLEQQAKNASSTTAPTDYQSAKDGELSLAETLTPAQTLTIKQLMDPEHDFTKSAPAPKTE
jgi:hypothetical protein